MLLSSLRGYFSEYTIPTHNIYWDAKEYRSKHVNETERANQIQPLFAAIAELSYKSRVNAFNNNSLTGYDPELLFSLYL